MMTAYEVYDKFFADEEYDLENASSELYSYRSGWNTALKRASIVIRDEIRPQGEWIIHPHSMIMKCSLCGHEENAKDVGTINPDKHFCSNCGADMRGKEE